MELLDTVANTGKPSFHDERTIKQLHAFVQSGNQGDFTAFLTGFEGGDARSLELMFCRILSEVQPDSSRPFLEKLYKSPNPATRKEVERIVENMDSRARYGFYSHLLDTGDTNVRVRAIEKLAGIKGAQVVNRMAEFLNDSDMKLVKTAFRALGTTGSADAVKRLEQFVEHEDAERSIEAINTLGAMQSFKHWKKLLPVLDSKEPRVREAAALNLNRKAGRKALPYLIKRLEDENDPDVTRLILKLLSKASDEGIAKILLKTASTGPDPGLRKFAGWLVGEIEEGTLFKAMLSLLRTCDDEDTQAYVLTRMGQRQLAGAVAILPAFISPQTPSALRYAALEGLGYLGDNSNLPAVLELMDADDPLMAYLAVMAAVRMVRHLNECPRLVSILGGNDDAVSTLKEVILQAMLDGIRWNESDAEIFAFLKANLSSKIENIAYLSTILIGRCTADGALELIADLALQSNNPEIRKEAMAGLDRRLDGDIRPLMKIWKPGDDWMDAAMISLLAELKWNPESVKRALSLLHGLDLEKASPQTIKALERLTGRLNQSAPDEIRAYFDSGRTAGRFQEILGSSWLDQLGEFETASERAIWKKMLFDGPESIARQALFRVSKPGNKWAVDPIIQRIAVDPDGPLAIELRLAVRKILDF